MSRSSAPAHNAHPNLTLSVLMLASLAYILLQSLVVPALPTIGKELGTTQATVTWLLTAYLLSASVATPILGRLGDMFGKRKILVIVLASLVVGSIVAATTSLGRRDDRGADRAGRRRRHLPARVQHHPRRAAARAGRRRDRADLAPVIGVGAGFAIVAAGPIVDNLSYHWLFWIPGGMALIAMVATMLLIPESPVRSPGRVSISAAVTLSGWLVALLLGVSEGSNWGWTSPRVLGLFVAAALLFVAWVMIELRSDAAARRRPDDADPDGVVDERRGDAVRLRHVLADGRHPGVHPDADQLRLRVRRVDRGVGLRAAADVVRDAVRRPHHGPPDDALRLQGAARGRIDRSARPACCSWCSCTTRSGRSTSRWRSSASGSASRSRPCRTSSSRPCR